jgi:hypothetical protein
MKTIICTDVQRLFLDTTRVIHTSEKSNPHGPSLYCKPVLPGHIVEAIVGSPGIGNIELDPWPHNY